MKKQAVVHTVPANSTKLAWHTKLDIAAVRLVDGTEALFLNGYHVPHHFPTQAVVAFCGLPLKSAKSLAAAMIADAKNKSK